MSSSAKTGYGVVVTRSGVAVAELTKVSGMKLKNAVDDVTNHDSTERWEEFISTIKSAEPIKIEGNLILSDAAQTSLLADYTDGLAHAYVVNFPTAWGASWSFNAIVTELGFGDFDGKKGGALSFTATMKITGKPTFSKSLSAGLTTPFFALTPAGTNIPAPSATPGTYVNSQVTGTTSVTVTPTATAGTITVNGATVVSGAASGSIALGAAGSITPITVVVQETGKVAVTYTILVARA